MKNVTIQISDELFIELQTVSLALSNRLSSDELLRVILVSLKLHKAIMLALLPKEGTE